MTPEELSKELANTTIELERWVSKDAPRIAGKTAADIYTRNFQLEGFRNGGIVKWEEVKRREDPKPKGAAATRKILTGETGNLGRSFNYTPKDGEVVVFNDALSASGFPYGQVHNKGVTDAGRNRNVTIPKRQIIGQSAELDRLIQMEIDRKLKSLAKK